MKNMRRAGKLRAMGAEKLLALDDGEFYDAVECLCYDAVYDIEAEDVNEVQRTLCSLMQFEAEVNNGGLCQYFVNSSRETAPYISNALGLIGAWEIKELFDSFVADNRIDLNDLGSFVSKDYHEYKAQTERFDFDSFDEKFYEDEQLHGLVIHYARDNIGGILAP